MLAGVLSFQPDNTKLKNISIFTRNDKTVSIDRLLTKRNVPIYTVRFIFQTIVKTHINHN